MIITEIAAAMGIAPDAVSKDLMFAKTSLTDTVWHIIDWSEITENRQMIALHGAYIKPNLEADSLIRLSLLEPNRILICQGCFDEFMLAKEVIDRMPQKQFRVYGGKVGRLLQ